MVHNHNHKHKHKHDHGHKHGHKHKHKHGHKHNHKHQGHHAHKHGHKHKHNHKHKFIKGNPHHYNQHYGGWSSYQSEPGLSHYKSSPIVRLDKQKDFQDDDDFLNPVEFNDDGFKSSKKSIRSEHIEIKELNPNSIYEGDKYIVRGAYKVQEGDPDSETTTTSYETYDSLPGKIWAQSVTNFGGKYDSLYPYKEEKESSKKEEAEEEGEGEGESSADHEDVADYENEDGDENKLQYENYEDYGDNTEVVRSFVAIPRQRQSASAERNYNYADRIEKDIISEVYG